MENNDDIIKFFSQYENIISLGYSCFPKKYLIYIQRSAETHFFDWLGTSLWTICDLIENDFDVFDDSSQFENMQIYPNRKIMTEKKYYIRLVHDDIRDSNKLKDFIDKYKRRANRFIDLMKTGKEVLFIRYQDHEINRIIHDEYKEKLKHNEFYYIEKLVQIIKNKYHDNFKILFINNKKSEISDDKHIIYIKRQHEKIEWNEVEYVFTNLFDENKKYFIESTDETKIKKINKTDNENNITLIKNMNKIRERKLRRKKI